MQIAGATDYSNRTLKEISSDLEFMIKYSRKITKNNKIVSGLNTAIDLKGIFLEIISFSDKLNENSKNNLSRFKKGKPTEYYCELLINMGTDANVLNCRIGQIWHNGIYEAKYNDYSTESRLYRELRDYIVTMIDLNNIGNEGLKRFFKNGVPLYKEINYWDRFLSFWEVTLGVFVDKIIRIFTGQS